MSATSQNVNSNGIVGKHPLTLPTIGELRQRAFINKADTENFNIRQWVDFVRYQYEQGDQGILVNNLERAYISYMRGCSIMVEVIKFHSRYNEIRQDPLYIDLAKRTNDEIFALLEDLASKIETWYKLAIEQQQTYYNNTHFNVIPVSPTTASAASYAYRPSHDPRNFPHYSLNDVPASPTHPRNNSTSRKSSVGSLSQAVTKLSINETIKLPSQTNNLFPHATIVEPADLAKWITAKENPPSILIIDIRPRDLFKRGCIKHQWIIQIEPATLQKHVTMTKIQDSLLNHPEAELKMFMERNRFDLVVYYDHNTKPTEAAKELRKVLESQQPALVRPPMLLLGGFDAWLAGVGERGVYRFPVTKKHSSWFKSNSEHHQEHHNSLYDYFTGNANHNTPSPPVPPVHQHISIPQPLPTAPRKESLTTRYPELLSPTSETDPPLRQPSPQQPLSNSLQQQQPRDLRPIPPSYPKLHRRRTFIDNPFNGFTTTTSKLYDGPPMRLTQKKPSPINVTNLQPQRPASTEPTVSISRPFALAEFHHVSASNIHVSPTSSSFSQLGTVVNIGTTGLKNLGNTCYMNSIIQCLSGTIPLARYFVSGVFRQHINRQAKTGSGGVLTETFADLLRAMWSESYNFVSPMTFREALIRFAPRFAGSDQQDSQEFLLFLLDGLHEDLNSASRPNSRHTNSSAEDDLHFEKLPDWKASAISWEKYMSKNCSIIVTLFQGQYRSRLTCLSCKQTSTTYNAFMSLSLPIPAKKLRISSMTLYQCLDFFVKEETLDKEDAWKCPQCKKKRKASKQLTLTKLPDILLIHLKRFSMDGLFRNKLDTMVKCPIRSLDLSGYVPMTSTPSPPQDRPSFIYDLYAVSNHYGSLTGGHYTAGVRDIYTDKWHYFDDSKFSLYDENKVVTKAAYNLFYVRSKVK